MGVTYLETFDEGPGGFFGWISNAQGPRALEYHPGIVTARSPWWIDYNHAPPGAGYLHLPFILYTRGPLGEVYKEAGGRNHFIDGKFPIDFTDARVTLRLKGEVETRGAQLTLLVQGTVGSTCSGWLLTGQPFQITPDWSEQTVTLFPNPAQWTNLGSRHDRVDFYGFLPLETILANVNADILLVFHPLDVAPMGPIAGDPHILRPEKDYPVWRSRLPEGYIDLDTVRIDFAEGVTRGE